MYSVYTWSWHPVPSLHGKEMEKQWKQCRLYFGGYKITADGDCSHEIKRHLLLRRKVVTNLDSILKSRDITLSTKVRLVKAIVFPVVMCGCESCEMWELDCESCEMWELWDVRVGLYRKLSTKDLMLCVGEDSWESLDLQGDPNSPSKRRSVLSVHWKEHDWAPELTDTHVHIHVCFKFIKCVKIIKIKK